jgi:predicted RNA-binding protein with TRAM domain
MYNRSRGPPRGGGFRTPPVKVGEELDVSIDAVGEKGDGIATKSGFVLFVPGVKVGDKVRIRVTKVLSKVGFAEVITGSAAPAGESAEAEAPAGEATGEEEAAEEESEDTDDFGEEAPAESEEADAGESEDSGESDGSEDSEESQSDEE